RDTVPSSESALTFAELFETNELKAQIQEKDTVILKLKEKIKPFSGDVKERKVERKVEEIETHNLELDHKVTKLIAENEHLKQTYKQLFDSIKSSRVQSKEQCDDLINKVNLKSVEVVDLNASLQEKDLVITALKEQLKGKAVLTKAVSLNPIDPVLLQVDVVPLVPKLRKNRTAHIDYIRHTQEEAATLREIVESERLLSPLNTSLAYAYQTGVALVSSASGSQSQDNTKKNRIRRTHKKAKETELEDRLRNVKSSLNKASVVDSRATSPDYGNHNRSTAFREMLHISPRIPNLSFAELPTEEEILDFLRDDVLFSTIKVVSRHQTTQQYGAILPIKLTTDEIRNSKAYKEYYTCAIGEATPKPKASARKKKGESASSTTPPTPTPTTIVESAPRLSATAKGKQPARAITPTEPIDTVKAGAGKDDDDNDEEEELAKDDDEDTESGKGGDEVSESKGESDQEETRQEEEESFDPIPRTPKESKDDSNDKEDQELRLSEEARIQEEEKY
nr:pyruvate, phosphate dikinase regulatory protein, chloroplastic [Tanacetum cinerariifolium]